LRPPGDLGGHLALVEDEDPVAHRQDLRQLAGDQDDCQGQPPEVRHDAVTSTFAPMSTPLVGSSRIRTRGLVANHWRDHLLLLPPECLHKLVDTRRADWSCSVYCWQSVRPSGGRTNSGERARQDGQA